MVREWCVRARLLASLEYVSRVGGATNIPTGPQRGRGAAPYLPPPGGALRKRKKIQADRKPPLPTSPEGAHKRPPMQGVLAAGRTRPLARHAPGACHQQGTSRLHPSLAVQGATVLRAGLFRRGASFTVACLHFSPPSLPTYCHPRFYASPGPRWRRSERRRSESDI